MKKSAYQDVFKQLVWGFFCGDIDSCLEVAKMVQARESNDLSLKGGCNFTAALVILCVIEMMAGYYKGKLDPSSRDVADFFVKYFSPYDPLFKNKDFSLQFYKVFRHGLAHQWSPKASAVAMNFNRNDFFYFIPGNRVELPCLNAPAFYELTKKALKDYEQNLDNGEYHTEFNKRYNEVIKKDYGEMEKLREISESPNLTSS